MSGYRSDSMPEPLVFLKQVIDSPCPSHLSAQTSVPQRVEVLRVLPRADRGLAVAWWAVLVLRGILPALFAIAIGVLVGAVQRGEDLDLPLVLVAAVFVPLQVLPPIHQAIGANLGSRTAAWLYDRLTSPAFGPRGWATSRTRSSRAT